MNNEFRNLVFEVVDKGQGPNIPTIGHVYRYKGELVHGMWFDRPYRWERSGDRLPIEFKMNLPEIKLEDLI